MPDICAICFQELQLDDKFCSLCGAEQPDGKEAVTLGTRLNTLEQNLAVLAEREYAVEVRVKTIEDERLAESD
jgi:predicted amidophosphoribosyltransferase